MSNTKPIAVKILNKVWKINCPEEAEEALHEAAHYLDQKMQDIRNQGRVIGLERIAIMAALNITHELLSQKSQKENYLESVKNQVLYLQNKIDSVLIEENS